MICDLPSSLVSLLSSPLFSSLLSSLVLSLSFCLSLCLCPCSACCCGCCVFCVRAVWCGTLKKKKKTRVHSKRPCVYQHHARMLKNMWTWCRCTRGRFECTPGGHLERTPVEKGGGVREGEEGVSVTHAPTPTHCTPTTHTTLRTQHRKRKESSPSLLTEVRPRKVLTWPQRFTKETLGSYTFENNMFPISATGRFGLSFATKTQENDRFERQTHFHDVVQEAFDLRQWFHVFATSLEYIYIYIYI